MKKTILFFASAALLASCSDFLEPSSQSQFSPTRIDQLNELLLSAMPDPSINMSILLEAVSDDVEVEQKYIPYTQPTHQWYDDVNVKGLLEIYSWQPEYSVRMKDNGFSAYEMYSPVQKQLVIANSALDYIEKVDGTQEDKDWTEAQGLALRAFYYLHLVNIYGVPYTSDPDGPGVAVRTTGGQEDRPITRNTVREVYAQIESDLLRAEQLFSTQAGNRQYRQHRPTLPMVLHLLSRMYLYMGEWEQAADYAEKLLKDWPRFTLLSLPGLVAGGTTNIPYPGYSASGPFGNSRDRQRSQVFYDFMSYENPEVIWLYGSASWGTYLSGSPLKSAVPLQNNATAFLMLASQSLIDSFNDENNSTDLRLRTYLVRNLYSEGTYKTNATTPPTTPVKYRAYGKCNIMHKGGYPASNLCQPETSAQTFGQALRISEAYLILAEAKAMLYQQKGDASAGQTAVTALNTLREKRFDDYNPVSIGDFTPDSLVRFTRAERRRELCLESLRWFDLRRWGMPEIKHVWINTTTGDAETYVLTQGDPSYTFPLPHTIFSANEHMTQVPLYNGGGQRMPVSVTPKK